ncbi:SH3 domain-containing protein [Tropicibacter naphthalenivorans]|uniref:Putative endopeptidase p60 n=1 Tax=Tropicibacter naphthalenivorans TaxID=441103 RepID=A0A0P1G7L8_9RHOB|nr:SH3 domain-containing protein [Tropicibacter naphthalenivorans]CUH77671.1 putative endopeptidase p60 precursor [Tropicibacter naphthalenivorans]SMC54406.1 SH3 domain-containing protein [Tropicibacter naphthalenivorans]
MKKILLSAVLAAATLTASAASATQAWVGSSALNARSGPGTNYHVLGTFKPCTPVHVVAHSHGWAKVAYNHGYYWVSAKYLSNQSCHYAPAPKKTHKKPVYKKPHSGYGY